MEQKEKKKKNSIATDLPLSLVVLLTAAILRRRLLPHWSSGSALESGGSFSIGFASFCLREEMASLASRSSALYLREEIASLASRSPALYLREGMAYLASRSPAFLR
ncbi:hypothetical protein Bca4012_096355 [Brassica carinata]